MVSNALSRRRHVIAAPAVCKPPPPPPPYPPTPSGCFCTVSLTWWPTQHYVLGCATAWLASLPDGDPVETWVHSTPELAWTNPYNTPNHGNLTFPPMAVPAGTLQITIVAGFIFSTGRQCSAHFVCPTPGA
jgi:hypothetical protein